MDVAIIGAGRLGRAVQHALHQRQATSRLYSRWSGFDVLAPDSGHDLGGADVVVEATDVSTQRADVAADFFSRSTRSVAAAVREAGASRHILVSIVHCDRPELQGNGYYAGKAIQERVAREESPTLTLVRSTTWYEFAAQNVERFSRGPFALVPTMIVRPVALAAVAGVVAECALEERARDREVAGPEVTTLWRMTRALSNRPAVLVPFPVPGTAGRAMRGGALLPGPDVEVIGPRFADWLRAPVDR